MAHQQISEICWFSRNYEAENFRKLVKYVLLLNGTHVMYEFKIFKGCRHYIFLCPFLNTLAHSKRGSFT